MGGVTRKKQGKSKRKMKKGKDVKGKGARKGQNLLAKSEGEERSLCSRTVNSTCLDTAVKLIKRDSSDQLPARLLMLVVVTPLTCPAAETKPTQEPQNSSPSSPLSRNVR